MHLMTAEGNMLSRTDRGPVAYLTLDSPNTLNALDSAMIDALREQFEDLAGNSRIRVAVLSGAGPAFCAGHDLKEITMRRQSEDRGASFYDDLFARCSAMMQMIPRLRQVVIAQVHGIATAAGCQLVAACDLAIADEETKFGVNGIDIGLFCSTPMVTVSRNIPRKQVFEMLVTGEFINARRALELGLINRVAPSSELNKDTASLANLVASKLGSALGLGKRTFYQQLQMTEEDAFAHAGKAMVKNLLNADTKEGIDAFLQKRTPQWTQ